MDLGPANFVVAFIIKGVHECFFCGEASYARWKLLPVLIILKGNVSQMGPEVLNDLLVLGRMNNVLAGISPNLNKKRACSASKLRLFELVTAAPDSSCPVSVNCIKIIGPFFELFWSI